MNRIGLNWSDYSVIALYFASMLAIGWYFSKRNDDAEDFLLGGRKMPYFPIAVSMLMTIFSTWSLVMGPGEIYNHGLDWGVMGYISPFFGVLGVMIFTRFFFKIQAFTPFEYLAFRYDKYARLGAALGSFGVLPMLIIGLAGLFCVVRGNVMMLGLPTRKQRKRMLQEEE